MLARVHLVRHAEVHNPGGVVYADLPGFPLSARGRAQAAATAEHLAGSGADVLVTSPLDRARETAGVIAHRLGLTAAVDERLTEWRLSSRWAGVPWDDLPRRFPGELEAYLAHPAALDFVAEGIAALAHRTAAVVAELGGTHPGAIAVVVSHQDPIHALRRHLTGAGFERFHAGKPPHAAIITLEPAGPDWVVVASWAPEDQGAPFPPASQR